MNHFSSDNIFLPSLRIPTYIQVFFKCINLVSSKLSVLLAAKLFSTPVKFKTPKRELPMLNAAQKMFLQVPSINKEIHVLSYGYSDKKVLLAHGWAGRSTQLFMIANKLLENGYMVVSFDGPAHGKSTGKTSNLLEYIESIKTIREKIGPFYAAVGHSFGGMAILNTQAETQMFQKLVTVGSADKVSEILTNFGINLGLTKKFGTMLLNHFEKKWKLKLDDFSSSIAAKKINIPVYIVHDALDGDVSVNCALAIRKELKKGKLEITRNLGHTKILRDRKTTNTIVKFIKQDDDEKNI